MEFECSNCGQKSRGGVRLTIRGKKILMCRSCGEILKGFLGGLVQTREVMKSSGGFMAMLKKAV